jgi:thiol-disulfide isomerase/thioredoxin
MMTRFVVFFAVVLCAAATTLAQDKPAPTLKVGDPAPKLSVERWVKGGAVKEFEKDKVYVVEFWATWCRPCINAIPHLTQLQNKHRRDGLVIIGVAGSERGATEEDRLKTLGDFMRKEGSKMGYTVAFDADRSMSRDWMQPAGRSGIPVSFVVDKAGKIAWIGHPTNGLDTAVAKALRSSGRAEIEAAAPAITLASFQPAAQPKGEGRPPAEPAKRSELRPGDPAPALTVEEWVKGAPLSTLEKGKVYVVEFWATWCGPCIKAIPHLTELQQKHKRDDVTIIAVAASERGNDDEAKLEKLRRFVADRDETMGYTVAYDADRSMGEQWLTAAGLNTIPNSFIVDKQGRIAWIGSPMQLDEPLARVVAGTWDLEAYAAEQRKAKQNEGQIRAASEKLQNALRRRDHDRALSAIDELSGLDERAKVSLAGQKFEILLIGKNDPQQAYTFANDAVNTYCKDDSQSLNHIAWVIVDPENEGIKNRDLDLALRAATRANDLTRGENGAILDTLAKVHFDKGDLPKALELQEKAVKQSAGETYEEELKGRLKQYRAAADKR